jgi:hypothetical protein
MQIHENLSDAGGLRPGLIHLSNMYTNARYITFNICVRMTSTKQFSAIMHLNDHWKWRKQPQFSINFHILHWGYFHNFHWSFKLLSVKRFVEVWNCYYKKKSIILCIKYTWYSLEKSLSSSSSWSSSLSSSKLLCCLTYRYWTINIY